MELLMVRTEWQRPTVRAPRGRVEVGAEEAAVLLGTPGHLSGQ